MKTSPFRPLCWFVVTAMIAGLPASPALADSIVNVAVPTVTFTGANLCGSTQALPCIETFEAFFQWDNTTNSVIPTSAMAIASGPLAPFSFNRTLLVTGVGSGTLIGAIWNNSEGDEITADIDVSSEGLTPGAYPMGGPTSPGNANVGLGCNDAVRSDLCLELFVNFPTQEFEPSPVIVTATPELSSLLYFLIGILVIAGVSPQCEISVRSKPSVLGK